MVEMFLDPLSLIVSLIACALYYGDAVDARYVVLSLVVFSLSFPGSSLLSMQPRRVIRQTVIGWLLIAFILLFFGYASQYIENFPQDVVLAWLIAAPLTQLAAHFAARGYLQRAAAQEANQTKVIIVGCNDIGASLAEQFASNPYLGVRCVGYFDDRSPERITQLNGMPLLGRLRDLAAYVKANGIDQIYISLPMASQPRILALLDDLKDTTVSIFFAPDIFVTDLIQGRMDYVAGVPVVAVCDTPFTGINGLVKRASDIALSLLILIIISPLLLGIAIGVKMSSPGPALFRQRRYGLDGKEIVVYKFRSMTVQEDGKEVKQATRNDQRITRFGGFLRRTSLDELPQFINVLQGRMSIVGPRPHAVSHNETYRKLIKGYMVRHKVKPGITGWAQVNGYRGETETVDKMQKRIEYDLEYLRTWSLGLDLWIIVKTIAVVFRDRNAY
ncbi:undecaprenyl-phosphate glucose phosphotransferase [Methyloversatilis thermotolerans]|uniref:undecaprenyl-phosphate glucose phosphotransferase n=1 Tax=Methyloversatilis thermotolerans TaxID=1346290 RepID=UPI000377C059|nr:undecaprenyl-phosphate glucose phosphotransferase [Methyloversatilis thermotolerans]